MHAPTRTRTYNFRRKKKNKSSLLPKKKKNKTYDEGKRIDLRCDRKFLEMRRENIGDEAEKNKFTLDRVKPGQLPGDGFGIEKPLVKYVQKNKKVKFFKMFGKNVTKQQQRVPKF